MKKTLVLILLICMVSFAYAKVDTTPILRIEPGVHTSAITRIAVDKSGRWLVSASTDKTAKVWDLDSGKLAITLRPPLLAQSIAGHYGELYGVAISPDGKTVAVGGSTDEEDSIYLFDRASGHMLHRLIGGFLTSVNDLAFSPDGQVLAVAASDEMGIGLILYSVADGSIIAKDQNYDGKSLFVDFGSDGRVVTTGSDGLLRLYRLVRTDLRLLTRQFAPGGKHPADVQFSPDSKHIAVSFTDTAAVNVLDATDLKLEYAPDTKSIKAPMEFVAWSVAGDVLFAAGSAQQKFNGGSHLYIRRWSEAGRGTHADWPVADNIITGLAALPDGRLAFSSNEPRIGAVNSSGLRFFEQLPAIADFRASPKQLLLSKDGRAVRFGYEYGGKLPAVFDVLKTSFLPVETADLAAPEFKASGVEISGWENGAEPKLNGKRLVLDENEVALSLAVLPDGFVLGATQNLRRFDVLGKELWRTDAPAPAWAVNVSRDGRWVVAAYADGSIRWHRTSDGEEQLAFYPHSDRKRWVMWTPSGYYEASAGGEDLIGWHVNQYADDYQVRVHDIARESPAAFARLETGDIILEINGVRVTKDTDVEAAVAATPVGDRLKFKVRRENQILLLTATPSQGKKPFLGALLENFQPIRDSVFFPASRFRTRFNRPDIIARIFETQDEAEALRLANEVSGRRTQDTSIAQVLPPVVEIISPLSDISVDTTTLTLRYSVRTAADAPVTAMRVRVNGLLQSDSRGLKVTGRELREIKVTIPEQDVEIQLFAENKNSVSTPAIVHLKWAGKPGLPVKPRLYVLAAGVSEYQDSKFNLGLAAKDARDFAAALQSQKGRLYDDVSVRLLTNDQASKDAVLEGLEWLKQQVGANDVGIMFIAGHGMNDKQGNYYFMPYNADPNQLMKTGVSQIDIKQTFANLPGKTVFFVDTCYSGSVLGAARTSGFINDMASAENGAVVFAAASAGQVSQENVLWGNGAFTKSVVEGLKGRADFRNTGLITAKGLDYYVDDRVKELTGGQQSPVSISPGGVSDFPIATSRK